MPHRKELSDEDFSRRFQDLVDRDYQQEVRRDSDAVLRDKLTCLSYNALVSGVNQAVVEAQRVHVVRELARRGLISPITVSQEAD